MSQHDLINNYIIENGSITPFEAFTELGITKLSTRVSEMKRMGFKFEKETITSTNRFGKTVSFSKYSFRED